MPSPFSCTSPLVLAIALCSTVASADTFVYVSNATDGTISSYKMAEATGALTPGMTIESGKAVMPMAVSPDRDFLYAAVRSEPYNLQTFAIDGRSGDLTKVSQVPVAESLAYISLDKTGKYLFGSSYDNDVMTVNAIKNGQVTAPSTQTLKTEQNAHSVRIDHTNHFVLVANLGGQQIYQYRFDAKTGKVTPNDPPKVPGPAGLGPRHLEFSPDNRFVYVLDELQDKVITYALDPATGRLSQKAITSALPADSQLVTGAPRGEPRVATPEMQPHEDTTKDIWAADIHITPDGNYLYTSERTSRVLSAFKVDKATGELTLLKTFPTEQQPRGFAITADSKFLVCSGEKSNQLSVFAIDPQDGSLELKSKAPAGNGANWVEILTTSEGSR